MRTLVLKLLRDIRLPLAVVCLLLSVRHVVEIAAKAGESVRAALWRTARIPMLVTTCVLGAAVPALVQYPAYAIRLFGR